MASAAVSGLKRFHDQAQLKPLVALEIIQQGDEFEMETLPTA